MPLLTALVGTTAHAVPEGSQAALCGTTITTITTTTTSWPGGASSLCRVCSREAASVGLTVPLRALGGRKRAGGM